MLSLTINNMPACEVPEMDTHLDERSIIEI